MVIPHFEAGHLRVTHPFATLSFKRVQSFPFDLHALGTPLAFILSQDQTLRVCSCPSFLLRGLFFLNLRFVLSCFCHFLAVKVLARASYTTTSLCFVKSFLDIKKDQTFQPLVFFILSLMCWYSYLRHRPCFLNYKIAIIYLPTSPVKFLPVFVFYSSDLPCDSTFLPQKKRFHLILFHLYIASP